METINERIRNKLSPIKNIIELINLYEKTSDKKERRIIVKHILNSKSILQHSLDKLIEIE